jgi:hypothetical protein
MDTTNILSDGRDFVKEQNRRRQNFLAGAISLQKRVAGGVNIKNAAGVTNKTKREQDANKLIEVQSAINIYLLFIHDTWERNSVDRFRRLWSFRPNDRLISTSNSNECQE